MIKKVCNFLNNHRIFLTLLLIFVTFGVFLGIKSLIFINHNFVKLECSKNLGQDTCYYGDNLIFINPDKSKQSFFESHIVEINDLKEEYELSDFNMFTAYFYKVASELDFKMSDGKEEVYTFFKIFSDTYNLEDFYLKNIVFYDLFYPNRISINLD